MTKDFDLWPSLRGSCLGGPCPLGSLDLCSEGFLSDHICFIGDSTMTTRGFISRGWSKISPTQACHVWVHTAFSSASSYQSRLNRRSEVRTSQKVVLFGASLLKQDFSQSLNPASAQCQNPQKCHGWRLEQIKRSEQVETVCSLLLPTTQQKPVVCLMF